MKANITIRHEEVDQTMKEYALGKINGLDKYLERITKATMVIEVVKKNQQAELVLYAPRGLTLVTHSKGTDLKIVIDDCVAKMERQLAKTKKKFQDKMKKAPKII